MERPNKVSFVFARPIIFWVKGVNKDAKIKHWKDWKIIKTRFGQE